MRSYNPLRVAKKRPRGYSKADSDDADDVSYDVEKHYDSDADYETDYSPNSLPSSRTSSASHKPMLRRSSSRTRKATIQRDYQFRTNRRFSRYFKLGLASTLILFILSLFWLHRSSVHSLESGTFRLPHVPALWEAFPFLKRYHGGIRTLVPRSKNEPEYPGKDKGALLPSVTATATATAVAGEKTNLVKREEESNLPPAEVFDPYPPYRTEEYRKTYGIVEECFLDAEKTLRVPQTRAYHGVVRGMPENAMGSYEEIGLRDDICFERFGRLGPYGMGYSRKLGGTGAGLHGDREGVERVWEDDPEVDFRDVKWAEVQDRCSEANRHRFGGKPRERNHFYTTMGMAGPQDEANSSPIAETASPASNSSHIQSRSRSAKELLPRTALLIRTWHDYKYDGEDLMYLRALVTELAIRSGGEYQIHFLIHVKDDNLQIWADDDTYQKVLDESLPAEFKGMGTLWSERQMGLIYGGIAESYYRNLPVHGAYRSSYMPVQYFAHQHPEFAYIWNWEMDVRYIGHYYHFFDKVTNWAKKQPRKGLWERNARFYIPSEHGSYNDFTHMVRVQTEHGTNSKNNMWSDLAKSNPKVPDYARPQQQGAEKPIWGPEPPLHDTLETKYDVQPPVNITDDNYEWGVGEDADLITFNPLFDPAGTNWILAEDVTGYNTSQGLPPRRTSIITASRLSRRLLETMHRETALKRHSMFTEMWPGSISLHHGFKAVYVPHPVYVDRRWPTRFLAATFNGGRNGASGGARTSVFSDELQHNFLGTSWYYHAGFAPNLWKRWLGYKVDNDGGEEWEMANEGRMCLPSMLLHPVKQVDLIYEHQAGDE